jgi:hypothetical protein
VTDNASMIRPARWRSVGESWPPVPVNQKTAIVANGNLVDQRTLTQEGLMCQTGVRSVVYPITLSLVEVRVTRTMLE